VNPTPSGDCPWVYVAVAVGCLFGRLAPGLLRDPRKLESGVPPAVVARDGNLASAAWRHYATALVASTLVSASVSEWK
jgi:hypothetical protein